MKKQRILLVFKAIIKYLMHYHPYMTVWVTVCVFYAIAGGIRKSSRSLRKGAERNNEKLFNRIY